jgi:peptidyl-prolyl cis-trans isomerase C
MKLLQILKEIMMTAVIVASLLPSNVFADDPAPTQPVNVAEVNGKVIAYKDFERQLEIFKQQVMRGQAGQLPEALMERAKTQVVDQMIAEELLYQESVKQNFKLEQGFVDKELKSLQGKFASNEQYQETLKRMQMTEDQLKVQIARQASIRKLIEKDVVSKISISKEDAQKYFESNTAKFHQPERVRAQHILIKVESGADDQKKTEALNKLKGIKKRILAGDDFGKLAKDHSEGPSNVREGDLGYFTRGRMVKPFEDAAFKLAPNEVSDIVETQFGYHLIKVLDHQPDKDPTFEEVEPKIMATLRNEMIQQEMEPYLKKLRENAKIQTFLN